MRVMAQNRCLAGFQFNSEKWFSFLFFFLSLLHNTKLVSQLVNLSYPWNTHLPLAVSNPKKFLLFYPFFCNKILLILHQKYLKIYISSILSSKTLFVVPFIFFARYLKPVGGCVVAFCCQVMKLITIIPVLSPTYNTHF